MLGAARVSSSGLSRGSSVPRAPELAGRWMVGTPATSARAGKPDHDNVGTNRRGMNTDRGLRRGPLCGSRSVEGLLITVVFTERSERVRIISARKANNDERRAYDRS